MSEAPERIWLIETDKYNPYRVSCSTAPHSPDESTEYVRADCIEALEREVAENKRRNAELEREIDGLRNSYWEERKAHLAAEADKARLSEEMEELQNAAERYLDVTKEYFSDTTYDANGILAEADAELFVLLYEQRRARAALAGSGSGWRECATEGCAHAATVRCARDGVESEYCHACYMRIWEIPAAPQPTGGDVLLLDMGRVR